ncbi:dipeptidase [Coxiella burnetii]|uniref:dipeptidase n=1 Tax=Coxiella burnetii TaxID=777 RepID=UPI000163A5A3|nr:membrane dipeptidase [Coxiella burnetii]ATN85355.1 peptidase [Coxiella burnetii str. Schperling]EDR35087.1 renal dipeptidase [Coxiella burnetii Q321]PHH58239.1 peptidase [Coxiella burnetii]
MKHLEQKIKIIKNQSIIADLALGFEPEIEVPHKWNLLDRYSQSGIHYVGLALAGEFTNFETAIRYISRHRTRIQSEPNKYIIVDKAEDILTAKKQKKLALGFWLQGSNPLANDINMVKTYYQLGIRYILLAYNTRNAIGDGVVEKIDGGLSQFGFKVIEEMNRVGMLIDLSHGGIKTSLEAIEASKDPVIFSHSNAYGVATHIRNLIDEQIIAVARKGGVVGVNGVALFLGAEKSSSKKFVDHIDYMTNLVGSSNHISLGLDLVYFHEILEMFYKKAGATTYPKGYLGSMDSFQPEKIDELIEELLKRGYSDSAIKNILGGNFFRVAKRVWK